ncbi:MAG: hypothetical protein QM756_37580 [Polyangiaceae bacterium]
MNTTPPPRGAPSDAEEEDASAVDPLDILRFVWGAGQRHTRLSLFVGAVLLILTTLVVFLIPPVFEASSKVLISKNATVTALLSNPNRQLPTLDATSGSADLLMRRENLQEIVKASGLVKRWEDSRSPLFRLKDSLTASLLGPMSPADKEEMLIRTLQTQLSLRTEDSAVKLVAQWRDAATALKLAQLAESKFLDTQKDQELSVVNAAITILEDELKRSADAIEPALSDAMQARQRAIDTMSGNTSSSAAPAPSASASAAPAVRAPTIAAVPRPRPAAAAAPPPSVSPHLVEIREAIRTVQEPWQRRLSELRVRLSNLRATYGPAHPAVLEQEARIREASVEPAELSDLRAKEKETLAQLAQAASAEGAEVAAPTFSGGSRLNPVAPRTAAGQPFNISAIEGDPQVAAARAKLTAAVEKYTEVARRLDGAQTELATAQAVFRYRYTVVAAPELPKKPAKPNRVLLLLGAIAASALIGFVSGAVRELWSGRIIEPWQVKRLGLPVLAEVDLQDRS